MKPIALFNNKGGVGKTTLVYHLAYMLSRLGYPTLAVDLDPQANLTSAFFDEDKLEELWDTETKTILACVNPILEGTGDVQIPKPLSITESLWLIPGDLGLSRFEDKLSYSWSSGYSKDPAALRATSAFHRIMRAAAEAVGAVVALIDVGPNLGAINRAALLAADFLVIPLAADLFSLQGLRNLGPTIRDWRQQWQQVQSLVSVKFELPAGLMTPAGYVVLQHAVRLDRPVRAYAKWLNRIPAVYQEAVLGEKVSSPKPRNDNEHCIATLRNYRSLMPMSQDARKPMFDLTYADGAIGSHAQLVQTCAEEFRALAKRIAQTCWLEAPSPGAVSILTNTIAMPDLREAIGEAVVQGIGQRHKNEQWQVRIYEPQDRPDYIVMIQGPNDFSWQRDFFGPQEQTPEFIQEAVRKATNQGG